MTQTIPGLDTTLTLGLLDALHAAPSLPLEFHLNGNLLVQPGYHVTEVKAVTIEAMDCGGKASAWRETVIQLMDGTAQEALAGHMTTSKFLDIYTRVARHVPVRGDAEVRFEYGTARTPALQYHVTHVSHHGDRVTVHLREPGVQCKAGSACGESATDDTCAPDSGCCTPITLS
ncbi:DUF6428 family protein [Deinococcus sedimenti]|uniref:Uncharacterized protein n=1 Tax=Deinococcus sedimenti TaxID=1867090 RepID=A0ABQ2S4B9_9DEIO|nr:DUF6428 family protein [Deinococcus sedimenti]GGR92754.1 hypothetical protein GCM10008960_19680 [Deinococcus sedimenti]